MLVRICSNNKWYSKSKTKNIPYSLERFFKYFPNNFRHHLCRKHAVTIPVHMSHWKYRQTRTQAVRTRFHSHDRRDNLQVCWSIIHSIDAARPSTHCDIFTIVIQYIRICNRNQSQRESRSSHIFLIFIIRKVLG